MTEFKPFTGQRFHWGLGLGLILVFGVARFVSVMYANRTGNYQFTSLVFLAMWVAPWILLSKAGRRTIGLKGPVSYVRTLYFLLAGVAACTTVYLLGVWLYGSSDSNWFVYISRSFNLPGTLDDTSRWIYFGIFAAVGMTFSPIGEELLYRGLIHQCFVPSLGGRGASRADSLAFALSHLAHFGLVFLQGRWQVLWGPALLWMIMIYLCGRLFYMAKHQSGSLWGAVICHAGFNLAMNYFIIFYLV